MNLSLSERFALAEKNRTQSIHENSSVQTSVVSALQPASTVYYNDSLDRQSSTRQQPQLQPAQFIHRRLGKGTALQTGSYSASSNTPFQQLTQTHDSTRNNRTRKENSSTDYEFIHSSPVSVTAEDRIANTRRTKGPLIIKVKTPKQMQKKKSKTPSIENRLGKTICERLGKTIEERLGKSIKERLGKSPVQSALVDPLAKRKGIEITKSKKRIINSKSAMKIKAVKKAFSKKNLTLDALNKQLDGFFMQDPEIAANRLDMELNDYMKEFSDMEEDVVVS